MALPTVTQTWTYAPNVRITFVSVLDAMQNYLYGIKNFLDATMGYTLLWSASGGTGPSSSSDHTDRITSAATITPRATTAGASQAWYIMVNGDGVQILVTFQGSSDDIARIAMSPGANYTLAGTTNNQPTATDEVVIVSATSLVDPTASADRVYWLWGTSDKKMFRVALFRSNVMTSFWGVEKVISTVVSPTTFSPAVVGFFYNVNNVSSFTIAPGATNAHAEMGFVHTSVNVIPICGLMYENYAAQNSSHPWGVEKPELQGSTGELLLPTGLASVTTNANGKLANKIDFWLAITNSTSTPAIGDTFGSLQFVCLNNVIVVPWDGASSPATA